MRASRLFSPMRYIWVDKYVPLQDDKPCTRIDDPRRLDKALPRNISAIILAALRAVSTVRRTFIGAFRRESSSRPHYNDRQGLPIFLRADMRSSATFLCSRCVFARQCRHVVWFVCLLQYVFGPRRGWCKGWIRDVKNLNIVVAKATARTGTKRFYFFGTNYCSVKRGEFLYTTFQI